MARFITRIADIFTFLLLTIVLLVNIMKFSGYFVSGAKNNIAAALLIATIAVFYAIGGSVFHALKKLFCFVRNISVVKMMIFLFCFIAISKIFLVFLLDNNVNKHDDMHHYLLFATQIAESGKITEEVLYASLYQYSVIYGWLLSPLVKLFGNNPKVFTTFLSVLFAVLSTLLFDIIRPYVGKNKAFSAFCFTIFFPSACFKRKW